MSTFIGRFYKNNTINTTTEIDAYVDRGNLHLDLFSSAEEKKKVINKGDVIVDPITDEEVTLISASTNGFYVQDEITNKKKLLPFKSTLLYNI